jgi:hypothetical protein
LTFDKVKWCKFIENTFLKIEYNGRNFNIVEKANNFWLCRVSQELK